MKTILALAMLFIMTSIGYAKSSIERINVDGYRDSYWSDVICLEGYKFAVVKVQNNNGIAITQIMKFRMGTTVPMGCNEKE